MKIGHLGKYLRQAYLQSTFVAIACLSACGGGGSNGNGDLEVGFSYGNVNLTILDFNTYTPTISGLNGNTPNCSVSSGSLPPGMSLQSAGCTVSGTPTAAGIWTATIVLSVDGYKGTLSSSASFRVDAPFIWSGTLNIPWGENFSLASAVSLGNFTPQENDHITFSLTTALPEGVVFDSNTGALSGGPTWTSAPFDLTVQATIERGGNRFTTAAVSIPIKTVQPGFSYDSCCDYAWGASFRATPTPVQPGATVTYALGANSALPPGVVIDPATGIISGTPMQFDPSGPWYWGSEIHRTLTAPGGETFSATYTMWPTMKFPYIFYARDTDAPHLQGGVSYNFGLPTQVNLLPGDVVSSYFLASELPGIDPVPAWLHVDPNTGELSATPPIGPSTVYSSYSVHYTILRNGTMRNGSTLLLFYAN